MKKFIVDGSFGHLTGWLRLLGYDCHYSADGSIRKQIIEKAKLIRRTHITRSCTIFEQLS